jgi:asparagine synthetase B (glutamine-hydrolysing)
MSSIAMSLIHHVHEIDPAVAPAEAHRNRPHLVWAAPGSLDTDAVERAWQRRGDPADLAGVSGPWAVVLWDPGPGRYVIASDPVGVQPVLWTRVVRPEGPRVMVSSWLDRLLDESGTSTDIDYEMLTVESVRGLHAEAVLHRTRFSAVGRVPWGRVLHVDPAAVNTGTANTGTANTGTAFSVGTLDPAVSITPTPIGPLQQYWNPRALPGPDTGLTLASAADLLRERIDTAVRRALPTDTALGVGAHVSGGLDCTAMACRANQVLREQGRSMAAFYSWAPSPTEVPRFPGDERGLHDDVTAQEGIAVGTIAEDGSGDWFFELDSDRYQQSTHVWERFVLPQAGADGISVMLSGWGGDELSSFNGRTVLRNLTRRGNIAAVWRQVSRRMELRSPTPVPWLRRVRATAGTVYSAAPDWLFGLRNWSEYREERAVTAEVRARLVELSPLAAHLQQARAATFERARSHRDYQMELLTAGHIQHRTMWWYQTGRRYDLDYRYPLLDVQVVETALQLPWWAYLSQGWGRVAYRTAVAPWVPASVAWNVTKYEPSRFAPPTGDSDQLVPRHQRADAVPDAAQDAAQRPEPAFTDPKFADPERRRIAESLREVERARQRVRRAHEPTLVSARPDAAPVRR